MITPGNSATGSTGSGTTNVIAIPADVESGDVLVAQVRGQVASGGFTISPPDGSWATVGTNYTDSHGMAMFVKVAGGSEPADYTFTYSVSVAQRGGGITAYAGVDNTTPQDVAASTNTGTSTAPRGLSITTATDGAYLILGISTAGAVTVTPPTGFDERFVTGRTNYQDDEQATAGASGDKDASLSGSTTWLTVMGALRPAAAPGGATYPGYYGSTGWS